MAIPAAGVESGTDLAVSRNPSGTGARHAAERLFLDSLEANPDAVVLVDETGGIVHANALVQDVFGYARDALLGQPLDTLIPERLRQQHAGHLAHFFAEARTRRMGKALQLTGRRKDGSEFPIDVALSPLHVDGRLLVAAAIRDMSVYRRLEAELRQRSHDLEEADSRKDQFLATLAHELRNPLAAMSLAGQRLRLPGAGERIDWAATVIDQESTHMLHLVDDLMDASRIRQGKVKLRMKTVDLRAIAAHAIETSRPMIDARGHAFDFCRPDDPVRVCGDETRLCQVVVNLLTNAARYTPKGGHIWLSIERDDRDAILRVRDTGIGIAPESIGRIFEMFTQIGKPASNAQGDGPEGGLGIGLALVKKLVAMHGGVVTVISGGTGHGSEFSVRLPLVAHRTH